MIMIVMTFTVVASPTSSSSSRDGGGGEEERWVQIVLLLGVWMLLLLQLLQLLVVLLISKIFGCVSFLCGFLPVWWKGMCLLILIRKSHPKKLKLATSMRKKRRLLISRSG